MSLRSIRINTHIIRLMSLILFFCLFSSLPCFADTFQLNLKNGLNYISIPIGSSYNIRDILNQVPATTKQAAFWSTGTNMYLMYANDPAFDQFSTFEYARGYWICLSGASNTTLTLTGTTPADYTVNLKKGWNAIGCPKNRELPVEQALLPLKLGTDYTSVWRYSGAAYPYQQYSATTKEFTTLKPGEGYWIRMSKDKVWVVASDTTPPTGTIKINNDAQYVNSTLVTLTLFAQDGEEGSGLSQMQFSNNGSSWSNPEPYATAKNWSLTSGDGNKTVYVKFKDVAGNWSASVSDTITLDTIAPSKPTLNSLVTPTNITTQSLSGTKEANSSIWINGNEVVPINTQTNWAYVFNLSEGGNNISISSKDSAGNESAKVATAIILDTVAPGKPQGLAVSAGDTRINLSWVANVDAGLAGYNIYRSINALTYAKINTVLVTTTYYQDTGLSNGTTYYYKVTAVDKAKNESIYSDVMNIVPEGMTISESEPNDNFSNANLIQPDRLVCGTINPVMDQDYFKITTSGPGKLYINLSGLPAKFNASMYLYDSNGKYIASVRGDYGESLSLEREASLPGDYYIVISDINGDYYSNSPYNLKVKLATFWIYGISAEPNPFSPNNDGQKDTASISASVSANSNWAIYIKDASNSIIRTYTGSGSNINCVWDGKDTSGVVVADGNYSYAIDATDIITGVKAFQDSGQVIVDNTLPTVSISSPLAGSTVSGNVDIKGLANDTNWLFADIWGQTPNQLYYGQGVSPDKCTGLKSIYSPAILDTNGNPPVIHTWDTRIIPNGDYVIRLDVKDRADNFKRVDIPVIVKNEGPDITELTVGPSPFTPDGLDDDISDDITDITFKLSDSGITTVNIYDKDMNLIRNIWNTVLRPDPNNNMRLKLQWNGRNNSGALVRNGQYQVVVSTGDGTKKSSANVLVNDRPIFNNFTVTPKTFSPDGDGVNDTVNLSFKLTEDSTISVEVYSLSDLLIKKLAVNVPATAGQVYNYVWDGKDSNSQVAFQGRYYFKVSAVALTGSQAVPLKMNVFLLYISDIRVSKDAFDPYQGQTTVIHYQLANNAKLTIKIYNEQNSLVRQLIVDQLRGPGEHSETWDGKNDNGNILTDGYYYFKIEDGINGINETVYDPSGTGGQDISHSISFLATSFDTLKNQPSVLTYSLSAPAKINVKIRAERYSGPAIRVLKYQEPVGSGEYQIVWDGRDETKDIVVKNNYTLAIWGYTLEDNAIIISGRPTISQVAINPIKFSPAFNPYAKDIQNSTNISFSLSKDANVTLDVYNSNNILVRRLLDGALKIKGTNNVVWDGKNDQGEILANGYYRVEIQADRGGNYSDIATAHTEVIY